ncbi:hypothetical protein K7X08_006323 [Anisodus acutangulus]|uniref:Uncharacterized protein n=1 Tax=Anisodus acutangulus TaxID=402998 RepID=A0A9Q1N169_9SOLA|nr:hypothetical protein K7X08_006323 [Anisodus acutangulus]
MTRTIKSKSAKKSNACKRKAPMDDVPQSEEGTTSSPNTSKLHKIYMIEEIVRKRKEKELPLRFAELGSKVLYLAALAVKNNGNITWVIHQENRIRLADAKVTKLVSVFLAFVKEAIDTALAPHRATLEPRILTEPRIDHSSERDDEKEKDNEEDRSERQSEGELDNDIGNDDLESTYTAVKVAGIPWDEVDTIVVK